MGGFVFIYLYKQTGGGGGLERSLLKNVNTDETNELHEAQMASGGASWRQEANDHPSKWNFIHSQ